VDAPPAEGGQLQHAAHADDREERGVNVGQCLQRHAQETAQVDQEKRPAQARERGAIAAPERWDDVGRDALPRAKRP